MYAGVDINTIIGSSMGGFAAYHISNALFRPALRKRSVPQNVPGNNNDHNNLKQIVIGQRDDVVSPADTLTFLVENFNSVTELHLRLLPRLGHRIPVELFEEEVESFFGKLCY